MEMIQQRIDIRHDASQQSADRAVGPHVPTLCHAGATRFIQFKNQKEQKK